MNHSIESDQFRPIPHVEPTAVVPNRFSPRRMGGALLATTALMLGGNALNPSAENTAFAQTPATQEAGLPSKLSGEAQQIVAATALAWKNHQTPDGRLIDPVLGIVPAYGSPMIGQAMIETGMALGDRDLVTSGIKAQVSQIELPDNKGFNVGFEVFGLADGYKWNQKHLADNEVWQQAQPLLQEFLKQRGALKVGESRDGGVEHCFSERTCWSNLKLVKTFAKISLEGSGVLGGATAASGTGPNLSKESRDLLVQAAKNSSSNATRKGAKLQYGDAGILSDPTKNPLAYNALSAMILGHVAEDLGPAKTPKVVTATLQKNAKALVGLMAPDGDVAYIGRGQGQVWNVAATANALSIAAKNTDNPVWRGRYLAGVARAIGRLQTVHAPNAWGMPLVPRLANDISPDLKGIDHYASAVGYNGLALWALKDTVEVLKQVKDVPAQTIGADVNGTFVDPSHTKFATVKQGNVWYAVHGSTTHKDARYDFGVVAAQEKKDGKWKPALPYRPYTEEKTSGGPVIISEGKTLVPVANSITSTTGGKVEITGGWSKAPNGKPSVEVGTKWTFKPEKDGVTMIFKPRKSHDYRFQVWYQKGSTIHATKRGMSVVEPNGRRETYTFNSPVKIKKLGKTFHSAYDENLGSSSITVHGKAGKVISYQTKF